MAHVVCSFAVERPPTPLLSPPAVAPGGAFRPSQPLLEAIAALDARSRRDDATTTPPSVPEFLSRALGGGAKRADVFVTRCGGSGSGAGCDDGDGEEDAGAGGGCCGYLVSRRLGGSRLAAARVSALGVREGCRRRGVATALVRACAAAAALAAAAAAADGGGGGGGSSGPVTLTLSVATRGNAAARALYARLGFKAKRRREEAGSRLGSEEEEEEGMEALLFPVGVGAAAALP